MCSGPARRWQGHCCERFFLSPASFLFPHEGDVACMVENPFHRGRTDLFTWVWLKHSSLETKEAETASDPHGKQESSGQTPRVWVPPDTACVTLASDFISLSRYFLLRGDSCSDRIRFSEIHCQVASKSFALTVVCVSGCSGLRMLSPCPLRIRGSLCGVTAF